MKKFLFILLAIGLIGSGAYFGISYLTKTQPLTAKITLDSTTKWFESATEVATPIISFLSLLGGVILLYLNIAQKLREVFSKKKEEKPQPAPKRKRVVK